MRLSKFLASSGVSSRRAAEELIATGLVQLNGRTVLDPAQSVSDEDKIIYDGALVKRTTPRNFVYLMLNKPVGVISTMILGKEKGICLSDIVKSRKRLHNIGRLDMETGGLILLTNDGDFTHALSHPSHIVEKEYSIKSSKAFVKSELIRLQKGIKIDERIVEVDGIYQKGKNCIHLTIHEGRNRIIRKLMRAIGKYDIELKRIRINTLSLGNLPPGKWRNLSVSELKLLRKNLVE